MENDLISVLIPAYNVQKYLGRCLTSVLKQTYQNLEIVVVDDGSTDHTYAVAKKYADTDTRVVLLQKANESNVAKTRNYLLDHCHGKYCVWVDSDDCIHPRYVEKLYQAMIGHDADISICKYAVRLFPFPILSGHRDIECNYEKDTLLGQMLHCAGPILWNKMYRMDLINSNETLRFDPKYSYGEDLLFNVRYIQRCRKMTYVKSKLYGYFFMRAGSESHKKFADNHINFMEKLLELCENEPNPIVRDTIRGWTAFTLIGLVFMADKKRYPDAVARMRHFAYVYRDYFYKNQLAKSGFKFILWLGLKTWCRPKKTLKLNYKGK